MLSLSAFPIGSAPGTIDQSIILTLIAMYCGVVFLLGVTSAFWLNRFPIDQADHEARVANLRALARGAPDARATEP